MEMDRDQRPKLSSSVRPTDTARNKPRPSYPEPEKVSQAVADEVRVDERIYWPIRRVASETKYSSDYIAYLCRTGQIAAVRLGTNWLVDVAAVRNLSAQRSGRIGEAQSTSVWDRVIRIFRRRPRSD